MTIPQFNKGDYGLETYVALKDIPKKGHEASYGYLATVSDGKLPEYSYNNENYKYKPYSSTSLWDAIILSSFWPFRTHVVINQRSHSHEKNSDNSCVRVIIGAIAAVVISIASYYIVLKPFKNFRF